MYRDIEVDERDGFRRGAVPCTVTMAFEREAFPSPDGVRMFHPDGRELPIQVDALQVWEDRSVRSAAVTFPVGLPANGRGTFRFEYGEGIGPGVEQPNPVTVREGGEPIEVQQGPVIYRVRRKGFNLVDQVAFGRGASGEKRFLRSGSRGMVLVLKDGRELTPEEAAAVEVETRGPRAGRLRVEGTYPGGYRFVNRLTFFSNVSWFATEHTVVSGDMSEIAFLVAESDFDLRAAPLMSAFGARQRSDGRATSWAVATDNESTVDAAVLDAWSEAGCVRYEVDADGRFRAILPFEGKTAVLYYHFLITPPMDHHHAPAAAMVAAPVCRVL